MNELLKASDDIMIRKLKELKGKFASQDWYRGAMFDALDKQPQEDTTDLADTFGLELGKFYFFNYSAKYPNRYPYWDMYPMAQILEVRGDGTILGANIHYLNVEYRSEIAKSWLNSSNGVPDICLHTYIITGMSNIKRVPDNDVGGLSGPPFIVELFTDTRGQRVSPTKVWAGSK
ncbi:MAG: hypothetical protein ACO25L_01285 [Candidatus Nanopelagicales bacterium]|nr:DNA end protector [Synechococcus phage DSL-LC03]